MAEQKFLGEAGTDVLVDKIKKNTSDISLQLPVYTEKSLSPKDLTTDGSDFILQMPAIIRGLKVDTTSDTLVRGTMDDFIFLIGIGPVANGGIRFLEKSSGVVAQLNVIVLIYFLCNDVDLDADFDTMDAGLKNIEYEERYQNNDVKWITPSVGSTFEEGLYRRADNSWVKIPLGSVAPAEISADEVTAKFTGGNN